MITLLTSILALPGTILLSLLSMVGLASWPRQIVRVVPKSSVKLASHTGFRGGRLDGSGKGENSATIGTGKHPILADWVTNSVPSLKGTFKPSWWLPK